MYCFREEYVVGGFWEDRCKVLIIRGRIYQNLVRTSAWCQLLVILWESNNWTLQWGTRVFASAFFHLKLLFLLRKFKQINGSRKSGVMFWDLISCSITLQSFIGITYLIRSFKKESSKTNSVYDRFKHHEDC